MAQIHTNWHRKYEATGSNDRERLMVCWKVKGEWMTERAREYELKCDTQCTIQCARNHATFNDAVVWVQRWSLQFSAHSIFPAHKLFQDNNYVTTLWFTTISHENNLAWLVQLLKLQPLCNCRLNKPMKNNQQNRHNKQLNISCCCCCCCYSHFSFCFIVYLKYRIWNTTFSALSAWCIEDDTSVRGKNTKKHWG